MASDTGVKPQKEINRLKAQIRQLAREKENSMSPLGKSTYEAFRQGILNEPGLIAECEKIRALDTGMEQAQNEITRLQSVVQQMKAARTAAATPSPGARCPACGAPVTPGLRFCGNCGAPQQLAPPSPVVRAACKGCGSPLNEGVRFCGECGQPAEVPVSGGQATQATPAAPQAPAAYAPTAATATPMTVPTPPEPPAPPPPAPAAPTPPGSKTGAKTCPRCGSPADEADAAFCGECGARF